MAEAAAAHGVAGAPRPTVTREAVLAAVLGSLEDVFEVRVRWQLVCLWGHAAQLLLFHALSML